MNTFLLDKIWAIHKYKSKQTPKSNCQDMRVCHVVSAVKYAHNIKLNYIMHVTPYEQLQATQLPVEYM